MIAKVLTVTSFHPLLPLVTGTSAVSGPLLKQHYYSKTKEDLEKLQNKLNEVLADYGDVVPRREYERLEALSSVSYTN